MLRTPLHLPLSVFGGCDAEFKQEYQRYGVGMGSNEGVSLGQMEVCARGWKREVHVKHIGDGGGIFPVPVGELRADLRSRRRTFF